MNQKERTRGFSPSLNYRNYKEGSPNSETQTVPNCEEELYGKRPWNKMEGIKYSQHNQTDNIVCIINCLITNNIRFCIILVSLIKSGFGYSGIR